MTLAQGDDGPNPHGARDYLEELEQLREEYPRWWFQYRTYDTVAWMAQRARGSGWHGGPTHLEALNPELLREQIADFQEFVDRNTLRVLRDELNRIGVPARSDGALMLAIPRRHGAPAVATCQDGVFRLDGTEVGTAEELSATARRITAILDMGKTR